MTTRMKCDDCGKDGTTEEIQWCYDEQDRCAPCRIKEDIKEINREIRELVKDHNESLAILKYRRSQKLVELKSAGA